MVERRLTNAKGVVCMTTFHEQNARRGGLGSWSRMRWLFVAGLVAAIVIAVVLLIVFTGGGGGGGGGGGY